MTKKEFFSEIRGRLIAIPTEDIESTLAYFDEMIDDAIEDGASEADAVASMGSPDNIAAQILSDSAQGEGSATSAENPDAVKVNAPFENIFIRAVDHNVTVTTAQNNACTVECEEFSRYFSICVRGKTLCIVRKKRRFGLKQLFSSPDLTVYLPSGDYRELKAETVSGDICVTEGMSFYKCVLTAVSGDVSFPSGKSKDLIAGTTSGDISVSCVSGGKCRLTSVSGDVEFTDSVCESFALETVSGNLKFYRCDGGQITLKSVSGDINGTLLSAKDFMTRTVGGSVRCPYPDENGGKCSVSTVSGDIDINVVG